MVARKLHSDRSDEKRNLEFVGEILAMIDNDYKKSIWS